MEAQIQSKMIAWLRAQGCVAFKLKPGYGVPTGIPDIFFCKEGFYGFIECKRDSSAPYRVGQERFLEKFSDWSYSATLYPENFEQIKAELEPML